MLFFDSNNILTHETCSWLEAVHQIFVLKFAVKLCPVAQSIPWFDADEWSMLTCWVPDTYGRSLEFYGYVRFTLFVENAHLLYLALVEDYRILCKGLLVTSQIPFSVSTVSLA